VDNSYIWFGVNKGGALTGSATDQAIISTTCASNGTCTRGNLDLSEYWVKFFVKKSANATTTNLTHEEFDRIAQSTAQLYDSFVETADPDLSAFRNRGGKIVGFHGTVRYYGPRIPHDCHR